MSGSVVNVGSEHTIKYDIENLKKYPDVISEGEEVVITEKLHGTFCMIGYNYNLDTKNNMFIASKGLGGQGLVFKLDDENKQKNVYVRIAEELELFDKISRFIQKDNVVKKLIICGEVFGKGVQNLHYGLQKPTFRAFDIYVDNGFIDAKMKYQLFNEIGVDYVPILYDGRYSRQDYIGLS